VNAIIITLVSKVEEENFNSNSLKIRKVNSKFECCMSVNFIEKEMFAAKEMFILYINFYVYDGLYLLGETFLASRSEWWDCHILQFFKVKW
jgi:hypothetical protein